MYVEERMYTLKVGTAPEYLRHYQNEGMKVQLKHLPHMVGYYFTDLTKIRPLMERQETRIMKCAPFFVERLKKMLAAVE